MKEFFAASYAHSRDNFCREAAALSADVRSYALPNHQGPAGEELAIDVAEIGPADAEGAIIILSGTHGIEGYAGAGCQRALMKSSDFLNVTKSISVTLVHAVNPNGFAHFHRVNESNVDLNRNAIDFSDAPPTNSKYEDVMRPLFDLVRGEPDYGRVKEQFRARCAEGGLRHMLEALQPGQYSDHKGIFYGGAKPEWSTVQMREIFKREFSGKKKVVVIDLHTGLGEPGVGEIILLGDNAPMNFSNYKRAYIPPISMPGGLESVTANISGPLLSMASIAGKNCGLC